MRVGLVLATLVALVCADGIIGGYILLSAKSDGKLVGLERLKSLAENAATLPINRLLLSFFSPTLVYIPNSRTLQYTGLNASLSGDYGFAEIQSYISSLRAGGVEVFLSIGGWNYNCYPYFYMRYSVGGYGQSTPNYWKIQQYGGGDMTQCTMVNQYCYVCEPPSEGDELTDFQIFPEPQNSTTWKSAKDYVAQGAATVGVPPIWNEEMVPGSMFTDPKTGISTRVPGDPRFVQLNRDPYSDFVTLAAELGADGVDLDYEEFWHADYFKTGSGPWNLTQTVYKYVGIAYDLAASIKNIKPSLKLSTAAGAVGGWSGNWWGGNLKGIWYLAAQHFPFIIDFMTKGPNAGGLNVMTYDLSSNTQFHECPEDNVCSLSQQVDFYMEQYAKAGMTSLAVGYEISTPAYPDVTHDQAHQLPLTFSELNKLASTQSKFQAGFLWELFKDVSSPDHASPTDVAQAICSIVSPQSPRCKGVIPGAGSHNNCQPTGCTVCPSCCKAYLNTQAVCDACVQAECGKVAPEAMLRSNLVDK